MRALVTGGAGFVGSHLIEALVARGDDVVCVERPGAGRGWIADLPVDFRDCGLASVPALSEIVAGADVVFHLAALTQARTSAEFQETNTEGTAHLVRAVARYGERVQRFVLMSSLAAAGPCRNGELLSPDTVPYPLSQYGQSKLRAEAVVHAYADRVPAVILRYPPVYGPRERALLKMFQLVRHHIALTVGGWDRESSLIYVGDVVASLLAAAAAPGAVGRTYCVAHPRPVTWREFALAVGRVLGRVPVLVDLPRAVGWVVAGTAEAGARLAGTAAILNRDRVREMMQLRWVCDARPAQRELGFTARWPIDRGVAVTAAWYEEAQWV